MPPRIVNTHCWGKASEPCPLPIGRQSPRTPKTFPPVLYPGTESQWGNNLSQRDLRSPVLWASTQWKPAPAFPLTRSSRMDTHGTYPSGHSCVAQNIYLEPPFGTHPLPFGLPSLEDSTHEKSMTNSSPFFHQVARRAPPSPHPKVLKPLFISIPPFWLSLQLTRFKSRMVLLRDPGS